MMLFLRASFYHLTNLSVDAAGLVITVRLSILS